MQWQIEDLPVMMGQSERGARAYIRGLRVDPLEASGAKNGQKSSI